MRRLATVFLLMMFSAACEPAESQTLPRVVAQATGTAHEAQVVSDSREHPPLPNPPNYPWISDPDAVETEPLAVAFPAPEGYARVDVEPVSFSAFLRELPVRTDRTRVRSYTGRTLASPSAAVVWLDVGERNLQQCADSIIRLHAEWLWSQQRQDEIAYHFTSGDESAWRDWQRGERFRVRGAKVERYRGKPRADSHDAFRRYLDHTFMYAGTRSLQFDSQTVNPRDLRPGDFFVAPGSPGHAVLVLDVATHADGRRIALLGQGFMPAQEFHVLKGSGPHVVEEVWFALPDEPSDLLDTPSWRPFTGSQARRFE